MHWFSSPCGKKCSVSAGQHYEEVKRVSDSRLGIPSQCIGLGSLQKNAARPASMDQYCANLAMKINAKLGGINALPCNPTTPRGELQASLGVPCLDEPFMIFGELFPRVPGP